MFRQTKIQYLRPHPLLQPYVSFINISYVPSGSPDFLVKCAPDSESGLTFRDNGPVSLDGLSPAPPRYELLIAGPQKTFVDLHNRGLEFISIVFKSGALRSVTGCPAWTLAGKRLPLERIWGQEAERLLDQVVLAGDPESRLRIIETHLIERITRHPVQDPFIFQALSHLNAQKGRGSLKSFFGKTGYSQQHVTRLFKDSMGLSPKEYSRIARFRHWFAAVHLHGDLDWTRVAMEHDYFDVPHLHHDFRKFTDQSPSQFMADFQERGMVLPGNSDQSVLLYTDPSTRAGFSEWACQNPAPQHSFNDRWGSGQV
jgi:AraC-like DNA-binding protein